MKTKNVERFAEAGDVAGLAGALRPRTHSPGMRVGASGSWARAMQALSWPVP